VRDVEVGGAQVAVIQGEAGIGKTWVLERILDASRGRGYRVLVGRADEVERVRPFGPLVEALDCIGRGDSSREQLVGLVHGEPAAGGSPIEPTRDPGVQFRVVDGIVDEFESLALEGPVVLAIEDLQWADSSTLLTVRALARRLSDLPLALLLTARPVPRSPDLGRLIDVLSRDGACLLTLGPLDDLAVAAFVSSLVSAQPSQALLDRVADAAGNPLFVSELVRALGEEDAIELVEGRAELRNVSRPPSLRHTILRRLTFLDDETLEMMRVASALGAVFSLGDVAAVLDRSPTYLLAPLRQALVAGVIEERDDRLGFRHDLIRQAIYEDLPQSARVALHLHAGRRLAATGAPTLRVAEQFALGAQPGDADAIALLHEAARQTARRDPGIAVDLLERALELIEDGDAVRPRVLADLLPPLLWSGRPRDAEARARDGLAASPPADVDALLRLGLVAALSAQGRHREVVAEAQLAAGHAELAADLRAQLHAEAANALAFVDDLEGAAETAHAAVGLCSSDPRDGADMALLVLAEVARLRGNLDESLEHTATSLARTRSRPGTRLRWPAEIFLAMALQQLDRFDEAHDALRQARQADEELGNVSQLPVYHYESATLHYDAGDWDDAVAQAHAGLALADDVGLQMLRTWPHDILALIAIGRGDLETATASLAAIDNNPADEVRTGRALGLLEEARGNTAAALAALVAAWDRDATHGVVYRRRRLGPDLVRLSISAGRRQRAEEVTSMVEEAAMLASVPSLDGAALRCRGLLENDVDLLLRAVGAYRRSPRTCERAATCEDAATALAQQGHLPEATALFDEALQLYEHAQAARDTARTLAVMRHHAIPRKRRGARKRPTSGWEALTPSELDVVRLVAQGLTNPEVGQRLYISRRTVQTHLAHAFRKLNITTRTQLAAEIAKRPTEA
jgi:DNA-binding CsgD family transcriptional regulator